MKITKYICANFLSLLGNLGLLLILSYIYLVVLVYPDYLIDGLVFSLLNIYIKIYLYMFPILIVLLPIEDILVRKLFNKDSFINIQIKNKYLRQIYNVIFWLGFICSFFYLFYYIYILILTGK